MALLLCLAAAPLYAATTERVSVSSTGEEGNGWCACPSLSADGRHVVFTSAATNLAPGTTAQYARIFVHDGNTGMTEVASLATDGSQPDDMSDWPSVSADGRYVAFLSAATNLVPGDGNASRDVFVRDRETGTVERASVSTSGIEANDYSNRPVISADGRYVVFNSYSSNLVPSDTNNCLDVFVRDRLAGTTERVSLTAGGLQSSSGDSVGGAISADGRYVAFMSWASDLVAGDTNEAMDVFIRDRTAHTTERVSVNTAGEQGNSHSGYSLVLGRQPAISGDGRYVAFSSWASNLVVGDTNGCDDVFVRDRVDGTTERVSVSTAGEEGDANSDEPAMSADGRLVVFNSYSSNLVPSDTNDCEDVFARDREAATTERIDVSTSGGQTIPLGEFFIDAVSADGRHVAFVSEVADLIPDDTNGVSDVFVRDRRAFADVPSDYWSLDYIEACVSAGVVGGYPDGTYHPADPVNRAAMAVYISRALAGGDTGVPPGPGTPSFSDVGTDYWAYKYVEYAVDNGVVAGYWDGTYRPDLEVNRGAMAVFIARAMVGGDEYVPTGPTTATFPDVPTDHWSYQYVEYCKANSVVGGYWDGTYRPEEAVNRGAMAVYVQRAFDLAM